MSEELTEDTIIWQIIQNRIKPKKILRLFTTDRLLHYNVIFDQEIQEITLTVTIS